MHTVKNENDVRLQIGVWTIIPLENCLLKGEQKTVVIPKVMDLLLYFSEHANQVLSIQQLSEAIWPNEFVGDNAIYNLIGQLRKALGDNSVQPLYIETLSKKGYRLIADVHHATSNKTTIELLEDSKTTTSNKQLIKWLVVVITVIVCSYLISLLRPTSETNTSKLSLAQQQYALGQFHLNKGQAHNIQKAINYFQLSLSTEPDFIDAMLALGFGYWQLAHLEGHSHSSYNNKAKELAQKMLNFSPDDPNILALVYLTMPQEKRQLTPLE